VKPIYRTYKSGQLTRRALLSAAAAGTAAGQRGELFELTVCPWTPENPRHDHQLIFPLSGGRLLLAWCEYYVRRPSAIFRDQYSGRGSTDEAPCRISGRISKDNGRTWSGKITLQDNIAADNVKHPNLLRLPSGEILFSFTARSMSAGTLRVYLKRSRDECETWDEPVEISPPGGFWFTNADHAFRHTSGRLIQPTHWGKIYGTGDHYEALVLYSDDDGKNWRPSRVRMDLPKRGAEEPAMVELKDGSILALLRTTLGRIYRSVSKDRGETWATPEPAELPSPSSASCLKRIPGTGDLLFLWNNATPYALRAAGAARFHLPRNPLTSAISRDEGRTWSNFKDIERREGYISAYPSVTFVGKEALVGYYHASESMSRDCELKLKIFPVDWFYSAAR